MKQRLTPEEFVKIAREIPRDERVPYAFEKRVMASLVPAVAPDPLALWTQALWRAVVPCMAVMLIAAAVSFSQASEAPDLQLDLERAVLSPPETVLDLGV